MTCEKWSSIIHSPSVKCPIFLQGTLPLAGTSHTFMSLMNGLQFAQKWNATLDTKLPTPTHHNIIHDLFHLEYLLHNYSSILCKKEKWKM